MCASLRAGRASPHACPSRSSAAKAGARAQAACGARMRGSCLHSHLPACQPAWDWLPRAVLQPLALLLPPASDIMYVFPDDK